MDGKNKSTTHWYTKPEIAPTVPLVKRKIALTSTPMIKIPEKDNNNSFLLNQNQKLLMMSLNKVIKVCQLMFSANITKWTILENKEEVILTSKCLSNLKLSTSKKCLNNKAIRCSQTWDNKTKNTTTGLPWTLYLKIKTISMMSKSITNLY